MNLPDIWGQRLDGNQLRIELGFKAELRAQQNRPPRESSPRTLSKGVERIRCTMTRHRSPPLYSSTVLQFYGPGTPPAPARGSASMIW